MLPNSKRKLEIQKYLLAMGYGWVKHPRFDLYVRQDISIAVIMTYKMLKFYTYDKQIKRPVIPIIQFSKNIDEHLWKKFAKDLIDYSIEDSVDRIIEEIERTIQINKSLRS